MKKSLIYLLGIALIAVGIFVVVYEKKEDNDPNNPGGKNPGVVDTTDFDYKLIKQIDKKYEKNYLISPLSIGYAVSILGDGADGTTHEQIKNYLGNFKTLKDVNVKNKISISNALFIKNLYKNDISNTYTTNTKNNYDADIIYDDFYTPKVMNDWVKEKTYNMIDSVVDDLAPDFVMGIVNAIAIDVEWKRDFNCMYTRSEEFTLKDGTKMQTAMMHEENGVAYIENDNAKGIIKDYAIYNKKTGEIVYKKSEDTIQLEYIAILPNKTIKEYVNIFDKNELTSLINNKKEASSNLEINLSLPKYTYDFEYDQFQNSLTEGGINDAFNKEKANFSKMVNSNSDVRLYVSNAIHKTHIELNEKGTKAAAVTAFMMMNATAMEPEKEKIDIKFNRPFIYIIKEKDSDNIWFFGTVYKPMKFEENTQECNSR